jgi:hypothetical protein
MVVFETVDRADKSIATPKTFLRRLTGEVRISTVSAGREWVSFSHTVFGGLRIIGSSHSAARTYGFVCSMTI